MNKLSSGVPQESTLGPLLFIIYVNDLPLATNITASHYNKDTLEKSVNNELINISNWIKLNRLSINCNKTEYIFITNKKKKPNYQIKIDKNVLTQSNCIKYLGVLIDESLS